MADYTLASTSHGNRVSRRGASNPTGAWPMATAGVAVNGCMVAVNSSGYALGTSITAATNIIVGVCHLDVDNTAGSNGDRFVETEDAPYWLDNDSTNPITVAHLERTVCYAVDNHTVGSSSIGGSLAVAGVPCQLGTATNGNTGKVAVRFLTGSVNALNPLLDAANSTDFTAHVVATNLAALTFTAGTFTFDANGALATQDGIANGASGIAVGNVIVFPTGTITTGVVSAANSGPWLLTAVGGASAKVTGIRPDWWPHGTNITPRPVLVTAGTLFGRTEWKAFADTLVSGTPLVIGTGDPKFYPVKVTQTVTLSSSAATITNVPIFSATRSNVNAALGAVGGTTTSTIGYGIIVAPTPGDLGTASTVVNAIASGGTKNGTSDTSILIVTIENG